MGLQVKEIFLSPKSRSMLIHVVTAQENYINAKQGASSRRGQSKGQKGHKKREF